MSVAAVSWALRDADVPAATSGRGRNPAHLSFVLVVLAEHADDHGRGAWPSTATIARLTRLTDDTVRRCLHRLEEIGLIVRGTADLSHVRADRRPTVWNLCMTATPSTVTTPTGATPSTVTTPTGATPSTVTTPTGAGHDPYRGGSRPLPGRAEPSLNREINHARTTSTRRVEPSAPTPSPPQYVAPSRHDAAPPDRAREYVEAMRAELNRKKRARLGA